MRVLVRGAAAAPRRASALPRLAGRLAIAALCLSSLLRLAAAAGSYQILGVSSDSRTQVDRQQIYTTCFSGFGLIKCTHQRTSAQGDGWMYGETEGLNALVANYGSTEYCLDCCSNVDRDGTAIDDQWDLRCEVSANDRVRLNRVSNEFRFARNFEPGDDQMVACPLMRSECIDEYYWYDEDESPRWRLNSGSLCSAQDTELVGYTLDLWVEEVSNGVDYWRSVRKCEITPMEIPEDELTFTTATTSIFTEVINMHAYGMGARFYMPEWQIFILCCVFLTVAGLIVQWFRDVPCPICNNKMVICVNKCAFCRMSGAELPDAKVIKELEARDQTLRGPDPWERDVCKRRTFFFCLRVWNDCGVKWLVCGATRYTIEGAKATWRGIQSARAFIKQLQVEGWDGIVDRAEVAAAFLKRVLTCGGRCCKKEAEVIPDIDADPTSPSTPGASPIIPERYSQFLAGYGGASSGNVSLGTPSKSTSRGGGSAVESA